MVGGIEVGVVGRLYTYRYNVTTRMIYALRSAATVSHQGGYKRTDKGRVTDRNSHRASPVFMEDNAIVIVQVG